MRTARAALPVLLACTLAACGGGSHRAAVTSTGYPSYPPPGTAEDPWGPYIHQASNRFSVPERWIRTVIHQESGGHQFRNGQPITSDAGAMGLMQLMPATYSELADRFGLGRDPYEPHDNIMAGTGYIKDLYGRFGSPAFLAAYNAGPHRVELYLAGHGSLPYETVNYLASTAPYLGRDRPLSGSLAVLASRSEPRPGPVPHAYARQGTARCWQDPDAAYDPDAPCQSAPAAARAPVRVAQYSPPPRTQASWGRSSGCVQDPNAAYDPDAPCRPAAVRVAVYTPPPPAFTPRPAPSTGLPQSSLAQASLPAPVPYGSVATPPAVRVAYAPPPAAQTAYAPPRHSYSLFPSASAATVRPAMSAGRWAIQVGAYSNAGEARRMAESVRVLAPRELGGARTVLGATSPFGGHVLYRARLSGLSAETASAACGSLQAHAQACVTVPPGG